MSLSRFRCNVYLRAGFPFLKLTEFSDSEAVPGPCFSARPLFLTFPEHQNPLIIVFLLIFRAAQNPSASRATSAGSDFSSSPDPVSPSE